MDLTGYVYMLRRYWMSIVAVTLVIIGAVSAYTFLVTPSYSSSTSLFFAVRGANSIGEAAQGSSYTEQQVTSFAEVATTAVVLQPVIDDLELDKRPAELARDVAIEIPGSTSILEITATDSDAVRAAGIATSIAENLVLVVEEISPRDANNRPVVEATVINPAVVPSEWSTPNVPRYLTVGVVLGLLVGIGQALLRQLMDRKIRNANDVAQVTTVPVIASISEDPNAGMIPLSALQAPNSLRAEDYRRLETALRFLDVGGRARVLAISSSIQGEGKSTTSLNLALTLSGAGQKVLLIDADLRRPTVASSLYLESAAGLTTVLIGRAELEDVIQPLKNGPDILASGKLPPNPWVLLGSDRMRALVKRASGLYDYVLIDSAPLVSVADTVALSGLVDGVLLVVAAGQVDADQLRAAIDAVNSSRGQVSGIVLNKVSAADTGYRSDYYSRIDGYKTASDGGTEGGFTEMIVNGESGGAEEPPPVYPPRRALR